MVVVHPYGGQRWRGGALAASYRKIRPESGFL